MASLDATLDRLNWTDIGLQLDAEGCAVLPGLLGADVARDLARQSAAPGTRRETLESRDGGCGELFYFETGLPAPLEPWRWALYGRRGHRQSLERNPGCGPALSGAAGGFLRLNHKAGQTRAQSHLSRLGAEDHVALHQRHDGAQVFPLQIVAVLSEPGADFQGGEFVMTEQRPRMQSRPLVVPLQLGDMAVIATAQRPVKGARGCYRVHLKHAVSRVRQGERIGLELLFHEAP
ncbi:2OG-Fe(II) oxygenase [Ottowia pentelensis]|uniref:2OG-Fe(II) oxygenase n=1 Tax=Ottowia pentelensis TaxID=511108 RepID=UPI00362983E9